MIQTILHYTQADSVMLYTVWSSLRSLIQTIYKKLQFLDHQATTNTCGIHACIYGADNVREARLSACMCPAAEHLPDVCHIESERRLN